VGCASAVKESLATLLTIYTQPRTTEEMPMPDQMVVMRDEWQAARDELLAEEKEHTRRGDELARKRRELPWVPIEKEYSLETEEGTRSLAELFDGRSQLLIYHFMFGPHYEGGCPTCSSMVDGLDGLIPHLHARDVTPLLVSRAPLAKLQPYKRRMGWSIPWASSFDSDFNFDFGGSFPSEQMREQMPPADQLPPIVAHNARATGTDLVDYISDLFGASVFTLPDA